MKVAHAQLSNSECFAKDADITIQKMKEPYINDKLMNSSEYNHEANKLALYQGPCSHYPYASEYILKHKNELQELSNRCIKNGQGYDCGTGIILTNIKQSDTETAIQTPTKSEELADDPQVFGGGASPLPTKTKKKKK